MTGTLTEYNEEVQVHELVQALPTPNDPNFAQQAGMIRARVQQAWGQTIGSRTVKVGVIDSGYLTSHPDLQGALYRNSGETPANGIDDDGNGYVDDVNGFSSITNSGFRKRWTS